MELGKGPKGTWQLGAAHFVITPQASRAPALPAGSVMLSSGLADWRRAPPSLD